MAPFLHLLDSLSDRDNLTHIIFAEEESRAAELFEELLNLPCLIDLAHVEVAGRDHMQLVSIG